VEVQVKFLVLAYGAEKDWLALSKREQDELLAQDDVLRRRGDTVAAVERGVTVKAWDRTPSVTDGPFARSEVPLAGFGIVEARDVDEAVALVAKTPCAVARGAVEIWPVRNVG
jgi:hypothetical protein